MIRLTIQQARMVFMTLIFISAWSLCAYSQDVNTVRHSEKAPPVVSATATPDSICDGEQSTLEATGSMGDPPYTYFWDHSLGSGSTHTVTPSVTTTYYVTITDDLGFTDVDSVTVVVFDVPDPNLSATPNPVCSGAACLLESNPTGGTSPYAYDWDHGLGSGSSHTVFPTTDETYNLTVTDINGCTATGQVTVTVNDNPTATATVSTNDICDGETVTLTASAAGGQSPYTYTWNNGLPEGISHDVSPSDTTTYIVTVSDANGCIDTAQVVVNVFPSPSVSATASPSPICANESSNISATASGGTSPYSYNWDNGLGSGNSHFVTPSDTTTYTVTVTDDNGCTSTDSVTVDVWELPVPNATATPSVICEDQPSDLSVTTSGGEAPYSYEWDHGLGVGPDHTVFPDDDITYTVTVTDDNGCSATDNVSIIHHDQPTVTATATPDTVCSLEPVNISAVGSGTTGPYSYTWNNGVGSGQNHTVYPAGDITYTVTVYDGNGCSATGQVSIVTYELPIPNPTATPNPICDDDCSDLSVTASDGVPPYSFTWDNGLGAGADHNVCPGVTTTYTVTATDANGCSSQNSVLLEMFDLPLIDLSADPNPICGTSSSDITTTLTGGYPPFTFFWDHGIGNVQNPTVNPDSTTTYHLTVTDDNGCTTTDSITIDIFDAPSVTASATPNPICEGQSVTLTASGSDGTPPYTYEWDNSLGFGDTHIVTPASTTIYTVTITDANGCTAEDQVLVGVYEAPVLTLTADPNPICESEIVNLYADVDLGYSPYTIEWDHGLGFGDHVIDNPSVTTTYHVTVTDNNGCQDSSEITVVVNENPTANISVTPNPVCEGDNATLQASGSGGVPPYDYVWDHGLGVGPSHTVSPTSDITYCVTVTDDNGCQGDTCIDLAVYPAPTVTASASDSTICPGESVDLSATGGGTVPSYVFIWDNGLGSGANHTVSPATTTTYTVTIQDGHGCTTSDEVTVEVINMPPANPTATPNPSCSGEDVTLDITMTGGIPPYNYDWDNGLGSGQTHVVNPFVTTTYTVTVEDATGCTVEGSVTVDIFDLPQTNLSASPNPICGTGSSTLYPNAFGGTGPYEFAWDNGLDSIENPTISPTGTTEYHLTITDNNGCTNTDSVTVNVYDIPDVTASASPDQICEGDSSVLTAVGSNGSSPYNFSWNNGLGAGSSHTDFPSDTTIYIVTITDDNGCSSSDSVTINVYDSPNINLSASPQVLCEHDSTLLEGVATEGQPPYVYAWNPPLGSGNTYMVYPDSSSMYEITVTDVNGCTSSDQVIVTVNDAPDVTLTATPNPVCYDGSTLLEANVTGGTPNYNYYWDHGLPDQPSHTIFINTPDTYSVTVEDMHGCEGSASLFVDVYPEIIITTNVLTEPTCYGDSDASFEMNVSGGTANYDITWTNGSDNGSFLNSAGGPHVVNNVTGGNYIINVIDANGCPEGHTFVLDQPDELVFTLNNTYPITCNGDNDGAIDYNISGGTELYELHWDNGTNSGTENNLTEGNHNLSMLEAGNYDITITDDYNCTTYGTFSLIEPPELQLIATDSSDVSCYNGSDGSITVNITGGTANYDMSWDNGFDSGSMNNIPGGSQDITGLTSGTWTISLVDDHGCTTSTVVTLDEPSTELVISIVDITDASCVGVDDGSAEVTTTGGVPGYTYTWDHPNGSGTQITNVTAGDYHVTVTDTWGCEDSITVTIGQPPSGLIIDPDITPVTCPGNSDGEIILNASGGTPSYTYNWDPPGPTGDTASNLATGDYDVTITDQGTCELQTTIFVPVDPNTLTASITDTTHISCNGYSDGEITVTASNGLFPYTYQWFYEGTLLPGETSNTISDVPAGNYEVIVTDDYNCEVHVFQTLNEPPPLGFTVDSITDVVCAGEATGSIYTTPQGGTPGYFYTWEDTSGNNQGVSGDNLTNVVSGTYYFSVTDINGCGPATGSATIDAPANPLAVNITIDNLPSCPGDNDGSITANPSGGTSPYTDFDWGPPIAGDTSQSPSNLAAGTYTVTVTDSEGCTAENSIVLNDPDSIQIDIIAYDVLCYGDCNGYAVAQVTGGAPNYTYHWEDALGNTISSGDTALNLCAGDYFLTVTDSHGCVAVASTTISEAFVLTGNITSTDVSTWGNNDGSATGNPSGGTPSYSYAWEDDSNPGSIISTNQTIDNLYAGVYNLTITDANGCTWTGSVTINEPNEPLYGDIVTHQNVLCAPDSSGILTAQGYGATPPYIYEWENSSGTSNWTGQTVEDLPAGTYYLTIYDDNNYSWDTTVTITQPPLLQITGYTSTNILCYGDSTGTASVTASGGVPYPGPPYYIYQWDDPSNSTTDNISNAPAGTYTVVVTDQNGCHADTNVTINQAPEIIIDLTVTATPDCYGENGGSAASSVSGGTPPYTAYQWENESGTIVSLTDTLIDKPAGWYYLYVTDNNGCVQMDSIHITEPELLTTSSGGTDATGYGVSDGIVWTSPDGGTEPYSYEWQDAANPGTPISTNDTVYNLPAGTYSVTITDDNGCQVIDVVTIDEPDELVYTIDGEDAQCYGESTGGAWIHVNGGVTPYDFYWTDEDDNYIWDDSVMVMIPAGWYYITVTDDNGYQIIDSVEIGQPPAIDVTVVSMDHVDCYGESNGSVNTNVSGGSPGYTYEWIDISNSTVIGTNDNISGLTAGDYQFTVVDDSTCTFDTVFTITEPDLFEATVSSQENITCYGDDNGYIAVDVTGGTIPYSLTWLDNTMATYATGTDSIANLSPGDYYFYAFDDNGCATDTLSFTITEPPPFVFDATIDSVYCYGESTGNIQLNPSGGTPNYNYDWDYEGNPVGIDYHILTSVEAGNYDVQVTDDSGCTYDTSLVVPQPAAPITMDFTLTDSIACYGDNNAAGLLQIDGGTPQYDILYSHDVSGDQQIFNLSQGNHMLNNLLGGEYTVQATDHYGCTEYLIFDIPYPSELTLDLVHQNISCAGDNNGEIEAIVNGGTPPYTYTWDGGVPGSDNIADNLGPGWHYLTVSDDNNCTIVDSVNIYEPDSLLISLTDSVYLDCYGDEDGSALASISGGTNPLTIFWTNSAGDTIQSGPYLNNVGGGTYYLDVTDDNGCTAHAELIVHEPTALDATMESFATTCPNSADGYAIIHMDSGSGTPPYNYEWDNPEHSVTDTAYNLTSGWWHVTVTDDNGCIYEDSVEVDSPDAIIMTFTIIPVQCNTMPGSVIVNTTGGTPSYDYSWDTGDNTGIVTNMAAGVHTVTVTDSEGCTASQQIMVGSEGSIHPDISITSPVSCYGDNDGSLTAMVDDGQLPYSFDWNTPDTTQTITDLPAGIYAVEVTDDWGCTGTDTITLDQPPSITVDFQVQDALCKGENSGRALAIAEGGNGSFTYNWDGGDFYGNPYTNIGEGYYQVVATDQNGCTGEGQVYVSEPDSMLYGIANTRNVTCYGYNNGRAIAQGYGGTPPYEYQWTGVGSDTINQQQTDAKLFPGNYQLQITDQNGCTYDTIVKIYQPSPIYVSVSGYGSPTCHGLDDGWIQLDTITGGNPPYTLFINGGGLSWTQNHTSIDSIPAGEYRITVYDANDCPQNSDAIIINLAESDEDCIKVPAAFSPNGDGHNDTWQIDHLELYRSVLIQVYNRWGQLLYEAGWNDDFWDGTYNGRPVPTGAYIYFIDLGNNKTKPRTGTVTVIR